MTLNTHSLFKAQNRAYWYSAGLHLGIILLIFILSYTHTQIFTVGTAAQSPQQVQIVNATLVLPTPSTSQVITNNRPAPAPPTPPTKTPAPQVNPKPTPVPTPPTPAKPAPQKPTPAKEATVVQKPQPQPQQKPAASSTTQNKAALQKLKALGLSSLQQAVATNQQEAASAAQAAKDLTLQQKYMGLIQQTVRSNWINQFDPNAKLIATLKISLDASGNVLSVSVSQSSGNPAFDRQAVLAVKKSSPLPLPPDPGLAKDFMNLTLPFSNQQ